MVNKSDRDGADALAHDLMLVAGERPIRRTTATTGDGVEELLSDALRIAVGRGGSRDRRLMEVWLSDVLSTTVRDRVAETSWEEALSALVARKLTPYEAAERILAEL